MDTEERDQELVEQAYIYLTSTTYPPGCDEKRKRVICNKAKKFELKDGELYYKQRKACCLKKKRLNHTAYKVNNCFNMVQLP